MRSYWQKAVVIAMVFVMLAAAPVAWATEAKAVNVCPAKAMGAKSISAQEKAQLAQKQAVATQQSRVLAGDDTRNMIMDDEELVYVVVIGAIIVAAGIAIAVPLGAL